MGILEDYEGYLNKYQKIYGKQTIVLLQNGHFYEMYGVDNEKEKVGLVKEMSGLLNIQMTRRTKAIVENNRSNYLLAGFPCSQLDRYVMMLTEEYGYVVIIVEQISPAPSPKRAVTNIIGPGTNIKYLSRPNSSYLVSIYIESEGTKINQIKPINMLTIGLSAIDVSTGQSIAYQVWNLLDDENRAMDETYRFIQTLQPKQIIINSRGLKMNESELIMHLDLSDRLVHCQLNNVPNEYYKLAYQNEFFKKVFLETGMLKPIEYIDLEKSPTALISYLLVLNFCYEQNETIISQIDPPLIWDNNSYLTLDNNCINQLNITSSEHTKYMSLFNLLDQTSTSMGRRLLKQKLLLPILDRKQIEQRYDYLEAFRQECTDLAAIKTKKLNGHAQHYVFQIYEPYLNQISDIERYHRKICLNLLQPCEFNHLDTSYQQILEIVKLIETNDTGLLETLIPSNLKAELLDYIDHYQTILDLNETVKYNINTVTGSFFNPGYSPEIDQYQHEINDYERFFSQLSVFMSNCISPKSDLLVSYEQNDDLGYHLTATTARLNTFLAKCTQPFEIKTESNTYTLYPGGFEILKNRNGKNCKITNPQMKTISAQLAASKENLLKKVVEVYNDFLQQLYEDYGSLMKKLVEFISNIDLYKSNAKTSLLYNYCRPEIDDSVDYSYLIVHQIRHPLIERLPDTCQYVPQDIDFNENRRGILLFGVNCAGKSSLMKALGLSVIMAQAGLYVPANKFKYSPYKTILTRIIGNDNLFKGLSSFAVEMGELRGILKRANGRALVLGDEICHGTETISAVSLVAAAIITLSETNTNFLFATHLHQLSQIERVIGLKNVEMCHLKVKFNESTGELIYDRRLEAGAGHPIYGLEVAKAMDLDRKFIELTNEIRKEIMEVTTFVPFKKSKYNSEVYMNQCCIPQCKNQAVDTHHIKFQSMADNKGFINNLQKNHKSNLIPLCKPCHQMVHNYQPEQFRYIINGYKMTNNGPALDYEKIINPLSIDLEKLIPENNCIFHEKKNNLKSEQTIKPQQVIKSEQTVQSLHAIKSRQAIKSEQTVVEPLILKKKLALRQNNISITI